MRLKRQMKESDEDPGHMMMPFERVLSSIDGCGEMTCFHGEQT